MGSAEGNPERPDERANSVPSHQVEQTTLVQRVRALTEALEGSDISELDLTEEGARILIRRQLDAPVVQRGRASSRAATSRRVADESAAPAREPGIAILAPLTGVFYGSPSPSSPPFVQVGEAVQAGQLVCLVEAMKVFNEIKSEISGTVTAVVAQNGQLVQKGEALIRVQPI